MRLLHCINFGSERSREPLTCQIPDTAPLEADRSLLQDNVSFSGEVAAHVIWGQQ